MSRHNIGVEIENKNDIWELSGPERPRVYPSWGTIDFGVWYMIECELNFIAETARIRWKPAGGSMTNWSDTVAMQDATQYSHVEFYFNGYSTIDNVSIAPIGEKAYAPDPYEGADNVPWNAMLIWSSGFSADSHELYIGTDASDVNDADNVSQPGSVLYVTTIDPNYEPDLDYETTYYWRVDEIDGASTAKGDVWSFTTSSPIAIAPNPVDGYDYADPWCTLSWTPGPFADTHELYLGSDYNDVNDSNNTIQLGTVLYVDTGVEPSYNPEPDLNADTTYYWRVDEVNGANTVKGNVWSFTTTSARIGSDPLPEGLIILSTDLAYNGPSSALATWPNDDGKWAPHPLVGYENSTLSMEGPLVADSNEDAAQLTTTVAVLPAETYYVYIRFTPQIKAQLVGSGQPLALYNKSNANAFCPLGADYEPTEPLVETVNSATNRTGSWEAYLGTVTGSQVEVIVDDVPEADPHVRTNYDGLVIFTQQQENARASERTAKAQQQVTNATAALDTLEAALLQTSLGAGQIASKLSEIALLEAELAVVQLQLNAGGLVDLMNHAYASAASCERAALELIRTAPTRAERRELVKWFAKERFSPTTEMVTFGWPIMNIHLPMEGVPSVLQANAPLTMFACRDEYKSVTFGVLAVDDLNSVSVDINDLHCGEKVLSAEAFDVRYIKWFNREWLKFRSVLLHDDSIMSLGEDGNMVFADPNALAQDSASFQPSDISAGSIKQYWVMLEVPEDQPPGVYNGTISVTAAGGVQVDIPLSVEILGFDLDEPELDYGFYYKSYVANVYPPIYDERVRTHEQFRAEIRNILDHGIQYTGLYQQVSLSAQSNIIYDPCLVDVEPLRAVLQILKEEGMATDRLFWQGQMPYCIQNYLDGTMPLSWIGHLTRTIVDLAHEEGFGDVYFYLIDEAGYATLAAERPVIEEIHANGGKVFVADAGNMIGSIGDIFDLPNAAPQIPRDECENCFSGIHHPGRHFF